MNRPAIIDSALIIAIATGVLYLVGYIHDSAELTALGLPTSFVYTPETLLLKGFSTLIRYSIVVVPSLALLWVGARILFRIKAVKVLAQRPVESLMRMFEVHSSWYIAIAAILIVTLLFKAAKTQGTDDATELIQARTNRSTQIIFKDGSQMIGSPFRSDDTFMVLVTRSPSQTGQMQVLVRRRDDISEIKTLQNAWAPPVSASSASRPMR